MTESMDNNTWNQQPYGPDGSTANGYGNGNGNVPGNNGHARSGSLLRDYRQQQSQHGMQQYSPPLMPASQGLPPPYSPVPAQQSPLQPMSPVRQPPAQSPAELSPRGWPPSQGYPSPPRPQGFFASTMQMVRSWSGKIMAVRQAPPPVPEPLVIYHPSMPEQPTQREEDRSGHPDRLLPPARRLALIRQRLRLWLLPEPVAAPAGAGKPADRADHAHL